MSGVRWSARHLRQGTSVVEIPVVNGRRNRPYKADIKSEMFINYYPIAEAYSHDYFVNRFNDSVDLGLS